MEEYIAYLTDISEGVKELAGHSRITHIFPFISCAAAEGEAKNTVSAHCTGTVKVTKVTALMENARRVIKCTYRRPECRRESGINVAVIDTGMSPHLDMCLPLRVVRFVDIINGREELYDDNGHGTAVCGALAGNGILSGGKYSGVATDVGIIPIKALRADGEGSTVDILQAMQWIWSNAEKYKIGVVCMSFGAEPQGKNDPLEKGAEALHSKGIVVVASSGNDGPEINTVKSPGTSSFVLTVGGACKRNNSVVVSEFSSRGVYRGIVKPDIIAPSENIICPSNKGDYNSMTGTSISTPMVAGACVLLRNLHPDYTVDKVRETIMRNATPIKGEGAGCGMLSMESLGV